MQYEDVYGYVGVYPEYARDFSDKILLDMEHIIKIILKLLVLAKLGWIIIGINPLKIFKKKFL